MRWGTEETVWSHWEAAEREETRVGSVGSGKLADPERSGLLEKMRVESGVEVHRFAYEQVVGRSGGLVMKLRQQGGFQKVIQLSRND